MKLIKLHTGLFKYLKVELKKQKTPRELVLFLKQVGIIYVKELIKLYRNLFLQFDPEFIKKKKEFEKYNRIKKDLQRSLKLLEYFEIQLKKSGLNRTEIRQFWNDFRKNGQVRTDVFNKLLKEIK